MKQLALPVAHRRWLFNAVFASVLIPLQIGAGLFGSAAAWVLCVSLPLSAVCWAGWWKTRPPMPAPAARTAVFPAGGAPAGCCPICGQHDPDGLDTDGYHPTCVEWLGEPGAERLRQAAERQRAMRVVQSACLHARVHEIHAWGGPTWWFCQECGARLWKRDIGL